MPIHLAEPPEQQFVLGKWRFWWPTVTGFSLANALLTAAVFRDGDALQDYMGAILLGVGALVGYLCVGALHYSDSPDRRLARGVAGLDSAALVFVVLHFAFLMWVYGHLWVLKSAEAKYEAAAAKFNVEAKQVSTDNVAIAQAAQAIARENTKQERLRNDTAYQQRRTVEAGAKIPLPRSRTAPGGTAPSLSTSAVELERPTKPAKSSADFLASWDSWIRAANFGELLLSVLTLILIRSRSAKMNNPQVADAMNFDSLLSHSGFTACHSRWTFEAISCGFAWSRRIKGRRRRYPPRRPNWIS